ncbi:MAG: hypothetical protein KC620_22495 [Myxococcales bacterium]|nr:hypothetical protein [Myxococcales bacterium]
MHRTALILVALISVLGCDDEDDASPAIDGSAAADGAVDAGPTSPGFVGEVPAEAPANEVLTLTIATGVPDVAVQAQVTRGGGLVPAEVRSSDDGLAQVRWTLGRMPVDNELHLELGTSPPLTLTAQVRGSLAEPLAAEPFGDVLALLEAEGVEGSTEDLVFTAAGLLVGVPEGLASVTPDGTAERLALSGDAIVAPLGLALDADGMLWMADGRGSALRRVSPDGAVDTPLTEVEGAPLQGPNYVAFDADGRLYLSDPCRAEIIRYDPSSGETVTHAFDFATEGGPNGMAVTPDGTGLVVLTENTGLLCMHRGIAIDDEVAGAFLIDLDDFSQRTPLATRLGLFGDGLAYDAEGNLYVIFDKQANFQLEESAILVLPAGGTEFTKVAVAPPRTLFANLAFGQGPYGETMLYIALLHVPPFTDAGSRGLMRLETGLTGLPLRP